GGAPPPMGERACALAEVTARGETPPTLVPGIGPLPGALLTLGSQSGPLGDEIVQILVEGRHPRRGGRVVQAGHRRALQADCPTLLQEADHRLACSPI